jgi:hypothetical protein
MMYNVIYDVCLYGFYITIISTIPFFTSRLHLYHITLKKTYKLSIM